MEPPNKHRQRTTCIRRMLLFIVAGGLLAFVLGIAILYTWGYYNASVTARKAVKVYHLDKIESMLLALDDDRFTLKDKNRFIEALGTFKDKRALPKLESMITNRPCNHQHEVCQYGLKKSILKIKRDYRGLRNVKPD